MSKPLLPDDAQLEQLVRTVLDKDAASVDAQQILAGVQARQVPAILPLAPQRRRPQRWAVRAAVAAAVIGVLFFASQWRLPTASAKEVVEQALHEAQQAPADRCYQMKIALNQAGEVLHPLSEGLLWTRGDRFMLAPIDASKGWRWGRDEQRRVWVAATPQLGFRFRADEIPRLMLLEEFFEVRTMSVETLLADVLQHCDLNYSDERGPDATTVIIHATPKEGMPHLTLRKATLELDAQQKIVKRVVLDRTVAIATFTLVETRTQPDAWYRLEGHLDEQARQIDENGFPVLRLLRLRQAVAAAS